ncbi:hypothetical protein TIFTF001_014238 [Ficus carica]|uniref:Uncharacterized protein n=1 Tax=Ficus carica TaxID=3494 RepID=A0AA88A4Z1_FICCA|nr:hypothetical protein TIFTF001_014238 [Ficus carica]
MPTHTRMWKSHIEQDWVSADHEWKNRYAMIHGSIDSPGCHWVSSMVWGQPKHVLKKSPKLTLEVRSQIAKFRATNSTPTTPRVVARTHSAFATVTMSTPKVKKEFMSHDWVMERITKPLTPKGQAKVEDSRKLATKLIDLDIGSPKSYSSIRLLKRKQYGVASYELMLAKTVSFQKDLEAASALGSGLLTQVDLDLLLSVDPNELVTSFTGVSIQEEPKQADGEAVGASGRLKMDAVELTPEVEPNNGQVDEPKSDE